MGSTHLRPTFDPREEPGALAAHAGICAGGEEQSSSLPRPADLLACAEMGRDRCGFSPFAAWSLVRRYHLRWRDFKVGVEDVGERSSEWMIGPYFQLLLDAEDATARMFSLRGTPEACQLVRDALAKYVRIND
jgi:hypothetical protein